MRYFFLSISTLLLMGCGDIIHSKQYTQDFKLSSNISLHVSEIEPSLITALFEKNGFDVNSEHTINLKISTDPLVSSCPVGTSHIAKEHFVRISIFVDEVEHYRIQMNQKEPIEVTHIEKVILKMKKEIGE